MPALRKFPPLLLFVLITAGYLAVIGTGWLRLAMSEQEFGYTAGRLAFLLQDVKENGLHWWEPHFLGGQQNISVLSYLGGLLPYIPWWALFDLITAFKIGTLVCLFFGALITYALGRELTGNSWAGFASGIGYLLSSQILNRAALVEHSMILAAVPLVPLSFLAVARLAKSGSWFDIILLAASFSGALLCYTKIGTTLTASLGIFWAAWFVKFPEFRANLVRGAFFSALLFGVLGLLPLLPLLREFQFMTIFELTPFTGWQQAFSMKSGVMWLDRGGELFLSQPSYMRSERGGYYLGLVGILAVGFVIWRNWHRKPARDPLLLPLRIFLGNALVMSWLSYGPRSVFFGQLEWLRFSQLVPDLFIPLAWLMLVAQALLIFWLLPPIRHRVILFVVVGLIYLFLPIFRLVEFLPGFNHLRAPDSFWILSGTQNWAVASGLAVVWSLERMPSLNGRAVTAALLLAAALLDNAVTAANFFRGALPAGTFEAFQKAANIIKSRPVPGSVLPLSGRYFYLYLPAMTGRPISTEAGHHNFMQKRRARLEAAAATSTSRLLAFLNVAGVSHVFNDKVSAAEDETASIFDHSYPVISDDEFFTVYENKGSLAPAFLARKAVWVEEGMEGIVQSLDLAEKGTLGLSGEAGRPAKPPQLSSADAVPGFEPLSQWGTASRKPDEVNLHLKNASGWVVLRDAWHPDWRAVLDGQAVPVYLGLGAFPAVQVGPQNQELRFQFRAPWWYDAAVLASGAGWIFSLGFLAVGCFLRKSRKSGELPALRMAGARPLIQKPLVIIPTFNESENIIGILEALARLPRRPDVLVVDDASPDGTARLVRSQTGFGFHLHLVERPEKNGLASAYKEGFQWARSHGYDAVIEMDGDFSHNPSDVPALLEALDAGADAAIGSRYLDGVRVLNWPQSRLFLSTGATWYVRLFTGLPLTDATSGFKALRLAALEPLDWSHFRADGYGFQVELHFWLWQSGAILREIPIVFTERHGGQTKMSLGIAREAAFRVLQLGAYALLHPQGGAKEPRSPRL